VPVTANRGAGMSVLLQQGREVRPNLPLSSGGRGCSRSLVVAGPPGWRGFTCLLRTAERARASLYEQKNDSQATKSQRWMPWRQMPMKDVDGCEKPRGAAYQASIRGSPNGETRQGSCLVTPA
jgi:hypothetical protein